MNGAAGAALALLAAIAATVLLRPNPNQGPSKDKKPTTSVTPLLSTGLLGPILTSGPANAITLADGTRTTGQPDGGVCGSDVTGSSCPPGMARFLTNPPGGRSTVQMCACGHKGWS